MANPVVVTTLIIGYVPFDDVVSKKPREIRADKYFRDLLSEFDLGKVHFANFNNWKAKSDEVNPLLIIVLGNDYFGHEVQAHKKNALIYNTYDAGQIFYRKAEIDKKREKQRKTFTEISNHVKRVREGGEKEMESLRKFATMTFEDMYNVIVKAIIGDDKNLSKEAWELLNNNNTHSDFVWMRAKLICETWEHADGKSKEDFLCLAMKQHVDNGLAYKMDNFFEGDQEFHQYMFCFLDGRTANYIRRIPVGLKGQDKYAYEAILRKYETPNGPQMMLEAGQMESEQKKYVQDQCVKFANMLKIWKQDPLKTMRELGVNPWHPYTLDDPLKGRELDGFKDYLRKHNSEMYAEIFDERNKREVNESPYKTL